MSKKKAIAVAVTALFMAGGIAVNAAATGPFGYDLQKDLHRNDAKRQEEQKNAELEKARQEARQQLQQNMRNSGADAQTINSADRAFNRMVDLLTATDYSKFVYELTYDEVKYSGAAKKYYHFVPIAELKPEDFNTAASNYPNPSLKSAISKYKARNYTGSAQELYSYIAKNPNDAWAYYYLGMNHMRLGNTEIASKCFQKVVNCNSRGQLLATSLMYACEANAAGNPHCAEFQSLVEEKTRFYTENPDKIPANSEMSRLFNGGFNIGKDLYNDATEDDLDRFIKAPYSGNGFSPELQKQYKQKELEKIQKELNRQNGVSPSELKPSTPSQDGNGEQKSKAFVNDRIAMAASISAEPTSGEVMEAIDVLKRAGLNITAGSTSSETSTINPYVYTPNSEYQQLNMMLGNNNNNNDPMMTMLPMMMNADSNGQKIDPQVVQALMTSSMMNSLNNMNSYDNK